MQIKLIRQGDLKNKTLSNWQLQYKNLKIKLEQDLHLDNVIKKYNFKKIYNSNNFIHWQKYNNSEKKDCELLLYAHYKWDKISDICKVLKNEESYIFLGINKYLLLPDDNLFNLSDEYDKSIEEALIYFLKDREIISYQYHQYERGNVGNFIIPDNIFLISCKKK